MITGVFIHARITVVLFANYAFAVTLRSDVSHRGGPLRVHIHVPKCAGSSFTQTIHQHMNAPQWWPFDMVANGCAQPKEASGEPFLNLHCGLSELETCIRHGKACFGNETTHCTRLVPAMVPLRFVMMIRNPIQRVLSEYYFFKSILQIPPKKDGDTLETFVKARIWTPSVRAVGTTASVIDWIRAPGNPAHNAITKAVLDGRAGLQAPVLRQSADHASSCAFFDNKDYVSHWQTYYGSEVGADIEGAINADQRLLSAAVSIIEERFDFVGLVEYFDASVSRLTSLWGLEHVPVNKVHSHASHKPAGTKIGADVVAEIRARNQLDGGLYRAVLEGKFWKDMALASNLLQADADGLTWQSVVEGDMEDTVFDPSVLASSTEQQ